MSYDICDMRLINLNSSNAVQNNGAFLSDVRFDFKNVLQQSDEIDYVTVGVLNAQIPVSFYTINHTNDTLYFNVNGGATKQLNVTRGNYNSNALIDQFSSQFTTLGYTFVITTSRINGVMTFANAGNTFTFYGTSLIFPILGFIAGTNYNSTLSNIVATYPLNLLGIKRLKINSAALCTNNFDSVHMGISSNMASIPVNAPSFGLIDYVNSSNAFPVLSLNDITYIDIQICDENENYINFNGINWTLTIQLNIYKKVKKVDTKLDYNKVALLLEDIKEELNTKPEIDERPQDIDTEVVDNRIDPELELLINN